MKLEDIIVHKIASDVASLEDVTSCYIIKDGEIVGGEGFKDLKEMAIIPAAIIEELCEEYTLAKVTFSDIKALVIKYEDVEMVVFFDKNIPETTILSDVTDIISGVSV